MVGQHLDRMLTSSQQHWLGLRAYLCDNRDTLARSAASEYPSEWTVAGTSLLTCETWLPACPLPLDLVDLELGPDSPFAGLTGREALAEPVRPVRTRGDRYPSYSAAMAGLAAPAVFKNRSTYRLLAADLSGARGRLRFGKGRYFDSIDVGEAAAHEHAAAQLGTHRSEPLRSAIGDLCDPKRRPVNLAISTLTVRQDRLTGNSSFLLHWRDPAKVGHAGGLYQVVPVGIFQPAGEHSSNERNDFSLWRCMVREYAEELDEPEGHGRGGEPIDYEAWPFAARMTQGFYAGEVRPYCPGLGVDPLTLATDLLTAVVFEAPLFDELFDALASRNAEGKLLTSTNDGAPSAGFAFTGDEVARLTQDEPMQPAGAGLLALAWRHRRILLG